MLTIVGQGVFEVRFEPNLVNYFLWGMVYPPDDCEPNYNDIVGDFSVPAFFLSSNLCIIRGYYCFKDFQPNELIRHPFFDLNDSIFVEIIELPNKKKQVFFELELFTEVRDLQCLERFIFGRTLTLAFAVSDNNDPPYIHQS